MDGRTKHSEITYFSIAKATSEHPRNDSASIVELDGGELFVVWIEMHTSKWGGHDEAPSSIASMRSIDGGVTWKDYRIEVSPLWGDRSIYNPSLVLLSDGTLLFFYLKYHRLVWNQPLESSGYIKRSSDGGWTWSDPEAIWDHQSYGCANDTFTLLSNGRLLKSCEYLPVWGSYPDCRSSSGCFISDDDGMSWKISENMVTLPLRGTMENHIAETSTGNLLMVVRNQLGSAFFSKSIDRGLNWTHPQSSGLSSSESMLSLTNIPSTGDILLVWNNATYDHTYDHSGKRTPLSLAISRDEGFTWSNLKDIEDDPTFEFSNISCTHLSGERLIVSYFTSRMLETVHPGRLGRERMSLKAAKTTVEWLYK
jgi:hypothetical protein